MAKKVKPKRIKEEDIPVSMKHLKLFKQEIMGAITNLTLEMREGFAKVDARFAHQDSKFAAIDARFAQQDAKFASIDSRFTSIDSRFASIETRLGKLETKIVEVKVIVEEQNDRNKAARDGYITVYEKLVEHDGRFQRIEKHIGLH